MPPLLAATAMAYVHGSDLVGRLCLSIVSEQHCYSHRFHFFNLCLIVAAVVRDVVKAWQTIDEKKMPEQKLGGRRPWTNRLRHFCTVLITGLAGAVAILPLSEFPLLILLLLFGQGPDRPLRCSPILPIGVCPKESRRRMSILMNIILYCRSRGHPFLVKPIRYGERHGHRVIVNRQLATANAFEDLLAERLPRFHRRIRAFYDAWGYPIARHIRRPWLADLVYLVMKPAEWLFILILYCFDVDPETRIAMQYLPQRKRINFDETISESHSNL